MKIQSYKADSFVARPDPGCRVLLVYGPDHGLMKERAGVAGRTVCPDLSDPFNVVYLEARKIQDDAALLLDEAQAISMMGGKRLIFVLDADDGITAAVKSYLAAPNDQCMIVLEGGDLGAKSSLRGLCERDANAASVPCYVEEGESLAGLIKRLASTGGYDIQGDAAQLLAHSLSGDRLRVRSEMEKLFIYTGVAGEQGRRPLIRIEDVQAVVADAGSRDLDDLVFAVGDRSAGVTLGVLQKLLDEGTAPVAIIRALLTHFRRLHNVKARVAEGAAVEEAMKQLNPKVFFKNEGPFAAQVRGWSLDSLEKAIGALQLLEERSKKTGYPEAGLLGQTLLKLAA